MDLCAPSSVVGSMCNDRGSSQGGGESMECGRARSENIDLDGISSEEMCEGQ